VANFVLAVTYRRARKVTASGRRLLASDALSRQRHNNQQHAHINSDALHSSGAWQHEISMAAGMEKASRKRTISDSSTLMK